jgi:hypothetical protein
MTRRHFVYLVASLVTLHNLEEAFTFRPWFGLIQSQLPATIRPWLGQVSTDAMHFGLVIATAVPWAVAFWSARRPSSTAAIWLVLLIQAVVLVNAFWHLFVAGVLVRGYAPGVITATLVNLPFSMYMFRRVVGEHWFSRMSLLGLIPAALFVHGPVLMAIIYFGAGIT